MGTTSLLDALETACHRYGPGRLPRADDPAIGAGYAGAAAALGVATTFAVVMLTLDGRPVGLEGSGVGLAAVTVVAVPLIIPTAFAAAAIVRRYLPASVPHFGAVAGVLATLLTYLLATGSLFGIGLIRAFVGEPHHGPVVESVRFAGAFGIVGFVSTVWLTLPVGCVSGVIYERVHEPAKTA